MRCVLRAKIRISEGRSKHRLDYAERKYLRRQPKIRISEGRSKRQAIKTASCRAVTIPCCNIAALSTARAEASARGSPPLWACSADFDPQLRQQPILTHPRDDGTEFLILILKFKLPIAGCFCARLAPLCGGRSLRLDRRRFGRIPNKFGSALGLHTLRGTSLRLDRLRLGKMQTSLLLHSACTIFVP